MIEKEKTISQKTPRGEHLWAMVPLNTLEEQGLLEEKLLLGFVWDETKFGLDRVIWGEPMEEVIPVQVHLIDPTKTTMVRTLYLKDT